MGGEISHDGDFLVFEGNHYRNGFMYKNFVMSAIVSLHMCHVHTCTCMHLVHRVLGSHLDRWKNDIPESIFDRYCKTGDIIVLFSP